MPHQGTLPVINIKKLRKETSKMYRILNLLMRGSLGRLIAILSQ